MTVSERVQVQSVLYNTDPAAITASAQSLSRAAELAVAAGKCESVVWRLGDNSPERCISPEQLTELTEQAAPFLGIEYEKFDTNRGHGGTQNVLAASGNHTVLVIQNPDVVVMPRALEYLLDVVEDPGIGVAEGKQLPFEHPKDFDPVTGDTVWAAGAFMMIRSALFFDVGGFDEQSFFMYCDDVDLSWRVRLAGKRVVMQPAAAGFHDKRMSPTGAFQPSWTERFFSVEGALMLAHKWSRPDVVKRFTAHWSQGDKAQRDAIRQFSEKQRNGLLPAPLDADHRVGEFNGFNYAVHRFEA